MKKLFFMLCLQIALFTYGYSQVIPKGMNYQAVARSVKGTIVANQKINLRIYLFSNEANRRLNHFIEIHEVKTNDLGLFNIIIGEGTQEFGAYGLIPWNTENIWMEVTLKDKSQSDFETISNSRLLAVPYAMHASTATRLSENSQNKSSNFAPPVIGVISNVWSIFGNARSDSVGNLYHINALGTTDKVDLFLITDNVERLRILTGGNIVTKLNFEIGQNLNVGKNLTVGLSTSIGDSLIAKKNVLFNTQMGSTYNYGPFSVFNMSPTLFSGTLIVDLASDFNFNLDVDGPTDLNDSLTVNKLSSTKFTGTLQVDSFTVLNDDLNVNQMSPTVLSGTLEVDSCATFNNKVKILSTFSTDTSGLFPSGSLQVGGGAYIKENLYVGGIAKFGGPVAFGGAVSITDLTQSIDPFTGALRVFGGVGIGLNLNVGAAAMIGGPTTISDLTQSDNDSSGALKVFGGLGIKKNFNVAGVANLGSTLNVAGITSMFNSLRVTNGDNFIANFTNSTNQHGISIQINNPTPAWANNYVEFRNNSSTVVGRIEGENVNEYKNNEAYIRELASLNNAIIAASAVTAVATLSLAAAVVSLVGAATSAAVCVGFGVCVAAPVISFIVKAALDVAAFTINVVATAVGIALAVDRKNEYVTYKDTHYGVTYESGAGDYAEWLPKADPSETLLPGYIVGLQRGKITKNVDAGGRMLVISSKPIVLGNMPESNTELAYEKVAFLGQVPVHVLGKVKAGDYILPSGNNDGLGKAIAPMAMQAEDFSKIVGVAWTSSRNDQHNLINVAIGLNGNDVHKVVLEQKRQLQTLIEKFEHRNLVMAKLIPGYQDAAGITENQLTNSMTNGKAGLSGLSSSSNLINTSNLEVYTPSYEQLTEILDRAQLTVRQSGLVLEDHPFWSRIVSEPGFKDKFIEDVQNKIKKQLPHTIEQFKIKMK